MTTYVESKKKIEEIRNTNETMFRMAISHLMDVGIRHLTEENINRTCEEIMQEDDSKAFMTNEFKCDLIRTAGELARIDHIHLLVYISREVYYDVFDDEISYERLKCLAKGSISWILADTYETDYALQEIREIGFEDEEIESLGYGWMLDAEEEE
jgi:ERCC4-related helicase